MPLFFFFFFFIIIISDHHHLCKSITNTCPLLMILIPRTHLFFFPLSFPSHFFLLFVNPRTNCFHSLPILSSIVTTHVSFTPNFPFLQSAQYNILIIFSTSPQSPIKSQLPCIPNIKKSKYEFRVECERPGGDTALQTWGRSRGEYGAAKGTQGVDKDALSIKTVKGLKKEKSRKG